MAVTGGGAEPASGDLAGLVVGTWPQWVPTFRLVRQLGDRGAEGTTYEAERLRRQGESYVASGERIALKVFDRDAFWRDKDAESRPLHERLHDLEDLAHLLNEVPGVVRFRSPFVGPDPLPLGQEPAADGRLRTYLPMELVEGPTLQQVIDSTRDAGERAALLPRLRSLAETLRGFVDARPDAPVSHRDVKPANLVLTGDEGLTLVDLGLLVSPRRSVTAGVGSFGFMAPEQQEAKRLQPEWAHRVDWFGFYATAASLLTGEQPPFSVSAWGRWLARHPQVTPRMRELLLAATEVAPSARPAPWEWLPRAESAMSDGRRVPLRRVVRRHRQTALASAAAVLLAVSGAAAGARFTGADRRSPDPQDSALSLTAGPRTVKDAGLAASTTWPLRPGCDKTTMVGMPSGLGPPIRTAADPRPAMLAAGAEPWRHGTMVVALSNSTNYPAALISLEPHRQSHTAGGLAWTYRRGETSVPCTSSAARRYSLDMDHMELFSAVGHEAGSPDEQGGPLVIPAHGSVSLEVDVVTCTNNFEFTMTATLAPQAADNPIQLNLGRFLLYGSGDGSTTYVGNARGSHVVPACEDTA